MFGLKTMFEVELLEKSQRKISPNQSVVFFSYYVMLRFILDNFFRRSQSSIFIGWLARWPNSNSCIYIYTRSGQSDI